MDQILEFFSHLLDSSDWPPRWHCGRWTEFHGWLYIVSDLLIWSAYFTIPLVIIRYLSKKQGIKFVWLYFLFAAFILACGATHFLDAIAFWIPVYRLNALVLLIIKDLQGKYLLVNRRFCELFHIDKHTILGKTDYAIFPKEAADAFRAMDSRVAAANATLNGEETAPHDDGQHTYI
jgi:PAS domain-containing protein